MLKDSLHDKNSKIQPMLNKALRQVLVISSNLLGLESVKCTNEVGKIVLKSGENLTKFLAFSDLGNIGNDKELSLSTSVIGALGLTAAAAIDDIAIYRQWYEKHHLAKASCAAYAGYKLSDNTQIAGLVNRIDNQFAKIGSISASLLAVSYLFGAGDMMNIMSANTSDCVRLANEIYELSNESVNIYKDLQVSSLASGVIGGGRQFLNDVKLDIGGPLNGPVSALVGTTVAVAASRHSERDFRNSLVEKFQSKLQNLPTEKISQLDSRAQKILEELPEYIDKASSSITKNATNAGIKTVYQQILAAAKYEDKINHISHLDMGFSVFVTSNLFNSAAVDNLQSKVQKSLKSAKASYAFNREAHLGKISAMQSRLDLLKDKKSESVFDTVLSCGKKLFNVIAPIVVDSVLVGMMHNKNATYDDPKSYKDAYMPVGSMVSIGETFVDIDAFAAIRELQYLSDILDVSKEPIIYM